MHRHLIRFAPFYVAFNVHRALYVCSWKANPHHAVGKKSNARSNINFHMLEHLHGLLGRRGRKVLI